MKDVVVLAIRAVAGGLLVMAFALISEGLRPKRFAGLTITLLGKFRAGAPATLALGRGSSPPPWSPSR